MSAAQTGRTHGCSDQCCNVKILLANPEPSTHGTTRKSRDVRFRAAIRGIADVKRLPPIYEYPRPLHTALLAHSDIFAVRLC